MDKLTGGLQPSLMFNSTLISIKLIHYFSCVLRNAPCRATFTKIKFPLATSTTAELSSTTFANSFANISTQSVPRIETLKATLCSCYQQSTSSSQFLSQIFSLNNFLITFLSSLVFNFSILWHVCLDPAFPIFLLPVFLGPSL